MTMPNKTAKIQNKTILDYLIVGILLVKSITHV
jgi:hypothetical protein